MPNVEVFSYFWNEEYLMPYFLRHYAPLATRITLFDNDSTDRSIEIAKTCPKVVVKRYDSGNTLDSLSQLHMLNNCWREAESDWVIVCALDEFLYHPDLLGFLEATEGTVIHPQGYTMSSKTRPIGNGQLYDYIRRGVPDKYYCKCIAFNKAKVTGINYRIGAHEAIPNGLINMVTDQCKLLHFRLIGLAETIERYRIYRERKSATERKRGYGGHYFISERDLRARFDALIKMSIDVFAHKPVQHVGRRLDWD